MEPTFDDHSEPGFSTVGDLFALGDTGDDPVQLKFVLTGFSDDEPGPAFFMDPRFYALHDEWYWFRLVNGQTIPGVNVAPEEGLSYDTIAAIYAAYTDVDEDDLPLDLRWVGERLYSPKFYKIGLWDEPRALGIGSVLYYEPNPERVAPAALWLFELEYYDGNANAPLSEERIARFFTRLEAALPAEVAPQLRWLVRSQWQEVLAESIRREDGPYKDRILTYADLVVAGEVVAYNPGTVAGRIKRFEAGVLGAAVLEPSDIVVLAEVPDYLPPVRGIITAVPQTPLAHLNLLAQSRGTPNAYVAGVMDDEGLADWEQWKTPVALRVREGEVTFKPLSSEEYGTYQALAGTPDFAIEQLDLEGAPFWVDLTQGGLEDMDGLVPLTGGKAAAMMAFQDYPALPIPQAPLGVTIRGYKEHIAPLEPTIDVLLGDSEFASDGRVRFLILEGEEDFRSAHDGDEETLAWVDSFFADHVQTFLGGLVEAGGLKRVIRDQPLDPGYEADLTETLAARYEDLSATQGLRFRSSSTAEDVAGFHGAGLYDSNTGFLEPALQTDPKLQKRTVGWALKKTWASYWAFEAFEERKQAKIDHLDGNMGVLVHPRFDDPFELANGVITLSLAREDAGDRWAMVVNVQAGTLSVTNPDPDHPAAPEIDRVDQVADQPPTVTRIQGSSEVAPGVLVLTDQELLWLWAELSPLADAWLDQDNMAWPLPKQRSTLMLDLEFKRMGEGWPATTEGDPEPERLVLKQVRRLDHGIAAPEDITDLPVPRDVLEQIQRVTERTCLADSWSLTTTECTTDPAVSWALDYATKPFHASFHLMFAEAIESLGIQAGHTTYFVHTDAASQSHPTMVDEASWDLEVVIAPGAVQSIGFERLAIAQDGTWSLERDGQVVSGELTCQTEDLLVTPSEYLDDLLGP